MFNILQNPQVSLHLFSMNGFHCSHLPSPFSSSHFSLGFKSIHSEVGVVVAGISVVSASPSPVTLYNSDVFSFISTLPPLQLIYTKSKLVKSNLSLNIY